MNLLTTVEDPRFQQEIEAAVASYVKEVHEITYVEHGYNNVVALVNKQFVFRFPRSQENARRIVYETALLQKTKGKIRSIAIPELKEVHTNPLYLVADYIPGDHMTNEQIKALDEADQQALGSKIAEFMNEFNQAVSGLELRRLRTESGVEALGDPWPVYFVRLFEGGRLPNSKLQPIIEQFYPLWKDYYMHEENIHAIHDDLHASNLLFQGTTLSGIVDFGDANAGSLESELRQLYAMGDTVLRSAIDRYKSLAGYEIQYDHVRVWAVMHALATFTNYLARQRTNEPAFLRARQNLQSWLPNFPF